MKNRYVLALDLPLIALAAFGAFAVRFDWRFYESRPEFPLYVLLALGVKPLVFLAMGMYRRYWRYASVQELILVLLAATAASAVMAVIIQVALVLNIMPDGFSRVVLFTDWILTMVAAGGLRFTVRALNEPNLRLRSANGGQAPRRVLIAGAGDAGTMVAREMRRNPYLGMTPVGFLDDDPAKIGKQMAGLRVLDRTDALSAVVAAQRVDSIIIAMPKVGGRVVRKIVELCQAAGVKSQTIPGVYELLGGNVSVDRLRNIDIEDLLRRSPVNGDLRSGAVVANQVVLITGAGGSIGSELGRQIAIASPARLVLLGHGENSIFEVEGRLRAAFPHVSMSTAIADIRDERRLARVFDRFKPTIVFHAAAHKHVPLMEEHPEEAVTNNIVGTRNVVAQALRIGTERFVLVSTDKAVAPSSVMGATKRIAEAIVRKAALTSGRAFVAVRFGNVLGSRGSVVNTFKAQIEQGGPITVTDPDVTRFFMTIPEAIHLVLQASGQGTGGELFVLDMGEPVKIVQLARDLIKLSGFTDEEIPITFTGLRPGEKLHERLYDADMQCEPTAHPEVLRVVGDDPCLAIDVDALIGQLHEAAEHGDRPAILNLLARAVPGFVASAPGHVAAPVAANATSHAATALS